MGLINFIKKGIWLARNSKGYLVQGKELLIDIHATLKQITAQNRIDFLRDRTLHSTIPGVSSDRLCDNEVIVSLTSYGKRIDDVHLAIESLMQGSMLPNRIILWLSEDEFKDKQLPLTLIKQQKRGLQICYCKDIKSFKKLIPTIRQYPSATVITIDDDVIYDFDMLERFVNTHMEHPNSICASRLRRISMDNNGDIGSYLTWEVDYTTTTSKLLFPIGVGGILYPPDSLSKEVLDESSFVSLCPFADDIWFFAMARLQGTTTVRVPIRNPQGYYCELPSSQYDALSAENTNPDNCRNDRQMRAVFERYRIADKLK